MRAMGRQQEMASKEPFKEHVLKQSAKKNTGANSHDLRNYAHQEQNELRMHCILIFPKVMMMWV